MTAARAIYWLWALTAMGCGSARVLPNAWARSTDVTPGLGRTQLLVESSGGVQQVGITRALGAVERGTPRWLCETPCTLYVPPGPVGLYSGAPGVRHGLTVLRVGAGGARVRLRAPDTTAFTTARAMADGGVLLGLVGAIFLVDGPIEIAAGSPTGPTTVAVGAGLFAIGAAFAVYGWRALGQLEPGAESVAPLAAGR